MGRNRVVNRVINSNRIITNTDEIIGHKHDIISHKHDPSPTSSVTNRRKGEKMRGELQHQQPKCGRAGAKRICHLGKGCGSGT